MTAVTRRALWALGLGAAAGGMLYQSGALSSLFSAPEFEFAPLASPAGFRRIPTGQTTRGGVPLFGLEQDRPEPLTLAQAKIDNDLCGALFEPPASGRLSIAYFFDYQCPFCKELTPALRDLSDVSIRWHDLAGLGPASESAARAAIAARAQGRYSEFHDRLMRARFQPTSEYVRSIAPSVGLDGDQLLHDMASQDVTDQLWLSRALAQKFGLVGTPGLVVGRTVVLGDIRPNRLQQLVDLERTLPAFCP